MTFAERKKFTDICKRIVEENDREKLLELFDELERFFDTVPLEVQIVENLPGTSSSRMSLRGPRHYL